MTDQPAQREDAGKAAMYRKIYFDAQEALDKILGPNEEDGAGDGLVADIYLVAEQRDKARAELAAYLPPLSGATSYPTYEQISQAWQETLDQQAGWRQALAETAAERDVALAEVDRLGAELARVRTQVAAEIAAAINAEAHRVVREAVLPGLTTMAAETAYRNAAEIARQHAGAPSGTVGTDNQESGS